MLAIIQASEKLVFAHSRFTLICLLVALVHDNSLKWASAICRQKRMVVIVDWMDGGNKDGHMPAIKISDQVVN